MVGCRVRLLLGAVVMATAARAQNVKISTSDDSIAVTLAAFRTAIVHGQLTAHGGATPEVLCLAMVSPPYPPGRGQYVPPDSAMIAKLREATPSVQSISACRIEPSRSPLEHISLVVDTTSGKRGLVIWVGTRATDSMDPMTVRVGYFEGALSAADWICAIGRIDTEWIVNACRMIRIS